MSRARADCQACEAAVRRALMTIQVAAHIVQTRQLPAVIAVEIRPYQVMAPVRINELRLNVEHEINRPDVMVRVQGSKVIIEIPAAVQVSVPARRLQGQGLGLPLGLTAASTAPEGVDFDLVPHLVLVGPTGCGKTTAMRSLVFHLARQNDPSRVEMTMFCTVAKERQDWSTFEQLPHSAGLITDNTETVQALRYYQQMMDRYDDVHRFLFIDDLPDLVLRVPDAVALLVNLAAQGRGSHIHLVIGTQRLGARSTGDSAIADNIPNRIVFRTADAAGAARSTGRSGTGAERLVGVGAAIVTINDTSFSVRISPATLNELLGFRLAWPRSVMQRPWKTMQTSLQVVQTPVQEVVQGSDTSFSAGERENEGAQKTPVQAVQAQFLPRGPAVTAEEKARVREVCAQVSRNTAIPILWGMAKNATTLSWLNESLK